MPKKMIDATDLKILSELQSNGRLSNVELAQRVNLSPSPCLARVRTLERTAVIDRYVAIVNPASVGLTLSVFIHVTLERQIETALQRFEAKMNGYPEVMECYLMTGDSDYLIRAVVRDVDALQYFIVHELSKIPGVANIKSSFSLKQVKYKTALPLSEPQG
jgi:Lrp/AsnC family transcriptional regulator, leucine-responsive regulatory protein